MSTVKANNHQIGQSVTATNNFTLYQPASPDGTVRLGVGNTGATTLDAVTVTNAGNVTVVGTLTATNVFAGLFAQVYTTAGSATFTIPTGVTALKVTVIGGGGGSGYGGGASAGNTGGSSSVASGTQSISTISATGGAGGPLSGNSVGGLGSGGDFNIRGGSGGANYAGGTLLAQNAIGSTAVYGGGGGVLGEFGGAGGGSAVKWLSSLTPGNTLAVTVGAGGTSGAGGAAGGAGVVVFEW